MYSPNERSEYYPDPKNIQSYRDRQATECVCMLAHMHLGTQRTRCVIIYCLVNIDLWTKMNCLEQTQLNWNSRSL